MDSFWNCASFSINFSRWRESATASFTFEWFSRLFQIVCYIRFLLLVFRVNASLFLCLVDFYFYLSILQLLNSLALIEQIFSFNSRWVSQYCFCCSDNLHSMYFCECWAIFIWFWWYLSIIFESPSRPLWHHGLYCFLGFVFEGIMINFYLLNCAVKANQSLNFSNSTNHASFHFCLKWKNSAVAYSSSFCLFSNLFSGPSQNFTAANFEFSKYLSFFQSNHFQDHSHPLLVFSIIILKF